LCSPDILLAIEQHYLDTFQPQYNVCKYADSSLGLKHSDETKAIISKLVTGYKMSEESRRRISQRLRGRPKSPEHIRNAADARRGYRHSAETRRKIGEAGKRKKGQAKVQRWVLISPDGRAMCVENLNRFASEHNLRAQGLYRIASRNDCPYKGWLCYKVKDYDPEIAESDYVNRYVRS